MKRIEYGVPRKGKENNKQPAIPDETYPADMEGQRSEPEGGDDKPGPKNPDPIPSEG